MGYINLLLNFFSRKFFLMFYLSFCKGRETEFPSTGSVSQCSGPGLTKAASISLTRVPGFTRCLSEEAKFSRQNQDLNPGIPVGPNHEAPIPAPQSNFWRHKFYDMVRQIAHCKLCTLCHDISAATHSLYLCVSLGCKIS